MRRLLSYGRQFIDDDDVAAVAATLRSDFLTTGPAVLAFENALKETTGASYALACANGTAALHLAMLALGVGQGDIVVVPSLTFLATANAARFVGAEVVFADVDPDHGLMTPQTLRAAIARSPKPPRAAIVVHLNGQTADLDGMSDLAAQNGFDLVEDACHALATRHHYRDGEASVGDARRSRAVCFSFHPVKTIAVGEGGAVTTADAEIAERVGLYRNHGMTRSPQKFVLRDIAFDDRQQPNPWHYEMHDVGFNYRLSDIHCSLGVSQLAKLPRFAARRRELAALYDELLLPLAPAVRPVSRVRWSTPTWHLYSVLIDFEGCGISRARAIEKIRALGIGTQVHYIPVHRQPYYASRVRSGDLPGADAYFKRQLSLPLFYDMSHDDVRLVVRSLTDVLGLKE
jgi:UDP-4-amino-4,6-dideoxy-N-acetyl-beta-L-altrosamine transaminase